MACKLSIEQVEALYKAVLGKIVTDKNNNIKHDPETFMKDLYKMIFEASGDQANALDYIQHVPKMIKTADSSLEEVADYLQDSGVSMDRINSLRRDFKDVNNIIKFLGLDTDAEFETAKEVAEEDKASRTAASAEEYRTIEEEDKDRKIEEYNKFGFIAKPDTALAPISQEAQDYDGVSSKQNIVDPDTKKKTYFAVVRKINDLLRKSASLIADKLKIGTTEGIFLRAVPVRSIPFEDLYVSEQKYLSTDDESFVKSGRTSAQKMQNREEGDEVHMVYTDKKGNMLYFDNQGNITSKEAGGKLAYAPIRRVYTTKAGRRVYTVQDIEALASKPGALPTEQLIKQRETEMDILDGIRKYIKENPNETLLFSLKVGKNGYVREDFSQRVPISSINLEEGFTPYYSAVDDGFKQKGGVYFDIQDYDAPVLIQRPKFSEVAGLTDALANVLFDSDLSNKEKMDIIKQFTHAKDTSVFERGKTLVVKQLGESFDVSDPANKEKFINSINKQTVNVNKEYLGEFFQMPTIENGKLKIDTIRYNDFIANNFFTNLQKNDENKIVKLNAYNTFALTEESGKKLFGDNVKTTEIKKESPVEQTTPTDNPVEKLKNILGNLGGLKKSTLLDNTATQEQIDAAKKWYDSHSIYPMAPYETMFNIVNSDAFAEWTTSGVTLFHGANYTDLYHEAWHVFSQMYLTIDQKKKLYNEMRNLSGKFRTADGRLISFNKAEDIDLEEFAAEDFRKYVLSGGKNIIENRSARNNIFSKIYALLKALFKGESIKDVISNKEAEGTLKEMYDKLWVGNINQYKPSLSNVQFSLLNKGIQQLGAKPDENIGLDNQDSLLLTETLDSLLAQTVADLGFSIGVVFTNPEVMSPIYDAVKFKLSQLKENVEPGSRGDKVIDFALNNWGDFKKVASGEEVTGVLAYHKQKSSYLTFDEKYAQMTPDEKTEYDGEVEPSEGQKEESEVAMSEGELRDQYGSGVFERKGNEQSVMEIASAETVYLIKSLSAVDEKGKPELNILGVAKPTNLNKTWGIVLNAISGSLDISDMYKRLLDNSKSFPVLKQLAERLGNPSELTDPSKNWAARSIWGAFHRDFSVYRIPITEVQVIREQTEEGYVFKVRYVESEPVTQMVEKNFTSQFQAAKVGRYISRTKEGENYLNLTNILEDFPNGNKLKGNAGFNFLRAIGFYVTDNPLVKENINNSDKLYFLHKAISKLAKNGVTVTNPMRALANEGSKKVMLNIEGKYSTNYSNNSVSNVNGDREWDQSLNNSITQVLKELNNPDADYFTIIDKPHMNHLSAERNPNAKYSVWLNSMFDLTAGHRKKYLKAGKLTNTGINIANLNGVKALIDEAGKNQVNAGGIKTTSLDIDSKFLMDVHTMLLGGVMELTRRASKSSAFGVSVNNLDTKFNKNDKNLYISTGYFADPIKANNAAVELLKGKIAAEMERIAIVKASEKAKKLIDSGKVKKGDSNYETVREQAVIANIPGFSERGKNFSIFDDILSDDLMAELIEAADENDSYSILDTKKFNQRISDQISAYLEKLYEQNKKIFDEMSFLTPDLKATVTSLSRLDSDVTVTNSDKIKEVALRSFTFNSLFHNMEVLAIIDGDLAAYNHLKEEYHKRNASVTSTGRVFSSDQSDYKFLKNLGNAYARSIGAPEKVFNGVLDSVVFKDNKVKSSYYEEYLEALTTKYGADKAKAILKPYEDMNEGDAQGWITFDAYRNLAILEGGDAWTLKHNELYNKIINGEEINPEEIKKFFPPRKFQYAGPVKTSKLDIRAFHKFSLVPLIPSFVKGTNMEIVHNNLVRQGIDYALFESGSKLGTLTADGNYDSLYVNDDYSKREVKNWIEGDKEYTKNPVFIQYLKNQVDIASEWKNKTIFPTQLRKLIINDLFRRGVPKTPLFDSLVNEFEEQLNTLQNYKRQELLDEIGWVANQKGEPSGDPEKLLNFVRKELTRQDLADHDIKFVDLNASKTGVKHDLSFSLNAEKIEKLLNAIVVKRLVRQKINGEQLIQVSGAGFETSNRTKFTKASDEQLKKYQGTNGLPTYRPGKGKNGSTTAMKVKIAIKGDYYKLLELNSVKNYAEKNKISPLDALNALIKTDDWLDQDDNRKLVTMVGVRIPVQGLNSMEFMEVYEFLPEEAGNILIPPSEIVAKSGSDFDIDKLTVLQPNYKKLDKNSKELKHAVYSKGENAKGTENKVIESIRKILEHPDNFDALIRPNDTDIVKGVADDLAEQNIQGFDPTANKTNKTRTIKKNGKVTKVISPTRAIEPRYNLYKHESNNIGKKTLGIGAVDNSYSSLFKRIGALLEPTYTYKTWDKNKNKWKKHNRTVHIAMKHNTAVGPDGKTRISLSDIETTTMDKVSDLISQLMNGWVDIEKDAWIFNINGNNVAGPILLFLLETGVDFRTAAYFVSQPLIIDYIKERAKAESPFYEASGKGLKQEKGLAKFSIRKNFISMTTNDDLTYLSSSDMYNKHIKSATKGVEFTKEALLKNIKSKDKNSEVSYATLMHFFELEDMARDLTNIKLTMNVDTKPSKTFYQAQTKLSDIEGLQQTDIIDIKTVNKLKTKSPIASFFVQAFQLNIFKPMMKLRADQKVNEFLTASIKNGSYKNTFDDPEKYTVAFKNDIPLYMIQNYMKRIDIDNLTEYNSLLVKEGLPVKEVQLSYGAFVKDGVMYIDKEQLAKDFNNKAYATTGYKDKGLTVLPAETFNMTLSEDVNRQEYIKFVLEREYQRSITPVKEGEARAAYEEKIAKRALEKTFNWYYNLKSKNSISDTFSQIMEAHPELVENYAIFNELIPVKSKSQKGIRTLKFRMSKLSKELINALHDNLVDLSDPTVIKVDNPAQNAEISKFFGRLIIAEYLRSGITKTSDSLAQILPTRVLMRLLEDPIKKLDKIGITDTMLTQYSDLFNTAWSKARLETRNKFRSYVTPTKVKPKEDTYKFLDKEEVVYQNDRGVNLFDAPYDKTAIASVLASSPGYVFIYPVNEANITEVSSREYQKAGNALSIPVKAKGGLQNWTDETYDSNVKAINLALDAIENMRDNGNEVVFPNNGLTTVQVSEMDPETKKSKNVYKDVLRTKAPRTFNYLATELYKRFQYIHPDAENQLGFREVFQSEQEISDKEVEEFMKKCFS